MTPKQEETTMMASEDEVEESCLLDLCTPPAPSSLLLR